MNSIANIITTHLGGAGLGHYADRQEVLDIIEELTEREVIIVENLRDAVGEVADLSFDEVTRVLRQAGLVAGLPTPEPEPEAGSIEGQIAKIGEVLAGLTDVVDRLVKAADRNGITV